MPYKDKYMEYLRGVRRNQEKREERRVYNEQYRKINKEKIRKQQHITQQKWQEEHREYYNMRSRAEQYCLRHKLPLAEACELCPEDEKITHKLQRHHPDYKYPSIFVTVCARCQKAIHIQLKTFEFKNK